MQTLIQVILAAGNGDRDASDQLSSMERPNLEGTLADLRAAYDEAGRRLAEAETAEQQALGGALAFEARQLMAARIGVARRFDEAVVALQHAAEEYRKYGEELMNHPANGLKFYSAVTMVEGIQGKHKMLMALPPIIRSLFRESELSTLPACRLAVSEANTWSDQLRGSPELHNPEA